VYLDTNNNGQRDSIIDPQADKTDAFGAFTIYPTANYRYDVASLIVDTSATSCIDTFTKKGSAIQTLKAPPQATFISPLSTILVQMMVQIGSYPRVPAYDRLKIAFGWEYANIDLLSKDSISEAQNDIVEEYVQVSTTNVNLGNLIASTSRLLCGLKVGVTLSTCEKYAIKAIAERVIVQHIRIVNNRAASGRRRLSETQSTDLLDFHKSDVVADIITDTLDVAIKTSNSGFDESDILQGISHTANAIANAGAVLLNISSSIAAGVPIDDFLINVAAVAMVSQAPSLLAEIGDIALSGTLNPSGLLSNASNSKTFHDSFEMKKSDITWELTYSMPPINPSPPPPPPSPPPPLTLADVAKEASPAALAGAVLSAACVFLLFCFRRRIARCCGYNRAKHLENAAQIGVPIAVHQNLPGYDYNTSIRFASPQRARNQRREPLTVWSLDDEDGRVSSEQHTMEALSPERTARPLSLREQHMRNQNTATESGFLRQIPPSPPLQQQRIPGIWYPEEDDSEPRFVPQIQGGRIFVARSFQNVPRDADIVQTLPSVPNDAEEHLEEEPEQEPEQEPLSLDEFGHELEIRGRVTPGSVAESSSATESQQQQRQPQEQERVSERIWYPEDYNSESRFVPRIQGSRYVPARSFQNVPRDVDIVQTLEEEEPEREPLRLDDFRRELESRGRVIPGNGAGSSPTSAAQQQQQQQSQGEQRDARVWYPDDSS